MEVKRYRTIVLITGKTLKAIVTEISTGEPYEKDFSVSSERRVLETIPTGQWKVIIGGPGLEEGDRVHAYERAGRKSYVAYDWQGHLRGGPGIYGKTSSILLEYVGSSDPFGLSGSPQGLRGDSDPFENDVP
jgi:hypothetical protein